MLARIKVSGAFGAKPSLSIDAPLKVSESGYQVLEKGDG